MGWISNALASFGPRQRGAAGDSAPPGPGSDYWYEEYSAPNPAGLVVSAESSLKVAAVFRSVTILADTLSTLPNGIFKLRTPGVIDGGMDAAPNHPVHDVISIRPNSTQTPAEFWGEMIFHATLRGRAYAEIIPGPRGAVDQLIPLHPDYVKEEVMPDRSLRFQYRDPKTGVRRTLLQEEVFRFRGLNPGVGDLIKTINLADGAVGLLMAADQYAARVFSNKINAGDYVTIPGELDPDQAKNLIYRLMSRLSGAADFHRPMFVPTGVEIKSASMKASDAQLLEARKWQISEVARYWGVPLHMLGVDDQTNRSTVEEQSLNFVRYTIRPLAEKIEQAIRRDLIIAPRFYISIFNIDELERGNMQARGEYFAKALGSGGSPPWLTQDEVRAAEGYNRRGAKADQLAEGTNPGQAGVTPPADQKQKQNQPADDAGQQKPNNGAALIRKQIVALRRLSVRHANDGGAFRAAVEAFYGGFVSDLVDQAGMSKDKARAWCRAAAQRVGSANDPVGAIDSFEEELTKAAA